MTKPGQVIPISEDLPQLRNVLFRFKEELSKFLQGKEPLIDMLLSSILSCGHILLEDVPGVGKTTLIKAISRLLGMEMKRVQCTSDLLPSDIIGVEVFDPKKEDFVFHPGPIFSNLLFVDELNRASPRTQSALLEAMGEGVVTIDKKTYSLPQPFLVFASQNPSDHVGTYRLPESQLDRFSICLHLDYPSNTKEIEIFKSSSLDPIQKMEANVMSSHQLKVLQGFVEAVFISERVAQYLKRFVDESRKTMGVKYGISTRGGILWARIAKAHAFLQNRDFVTPDDLIQSAPFALAHRIVFSNSGMQSKESIEELVRKIRIEPE